MAKSNPENREKNRSGWMTESYGCRLSTCRKKSAFATRLQELSIIFDILKIVKR